MNMSGIIRLICTASCLAILPLPSYALTPAQVFDKVKDSIVVVNTLNAQGKDKSQGSGVLLSSGKVATNCHVVEEGVFYRVSRGKQLVSAVLFAEDRDKDICILYVKGIKGKPVILGKAANLKVGDPVYAVGAPKGLELSLSNGIVSQLRGGPPPFIQTTAAISPGSSGGGLFDGEGRLVGITTASMRGGQSLNFAMPVEWIGEVKPGRKLLTGTLGQAEWHKRTLVLAENKDWKGLLECGLDRLKSDPKSAEAWFVVGGAYNKLNRYDEAIGALREVLRINPEFAVAWHFLGASYLGLKRYDDAVNALRQALRINPELASAWKDLGIAYDALQRNDDAISAYRQAVSIKPEFADAWFNLGNTYFRLNRKEDAIAAYREALRINPETAEAWLTLGVAYYTLKRYEDAIGACRQSSRINPELTLAWQCLGNAYALSGNRTAALEVVKELRRLDPASADELFNLVVPR